MICCSQAVRTTLELESGHCGAVFALTDLTWSLNKDSELHLLFSCADGTVHIYHRPSKMGAEFMKINVFRVHRHLATVGGGSVKVWIIDSDNNWSTSLWATVPSQGNIARSVHFSPDGCNIIVTFLDTHEVYFCVEHRAMALGVAYTIIYSDVRLPNLSCNPQ
ncbi:hypothetical protein K439DRAFT_1622654 [Ramaria rubella]|nr:hypothetical protein K439DRAFT_1622654 [Ramaria rubella]